MYPGHVNLSDKKRLARLPVKDCVIVSTTPGGTEVVVTVTAGVEDVEMEVNVRVKV